ncbi:MAG: hypothetical protein SOR76_05830 [Streptococcus dysgalactiae]|nr:hypothetical protein [Streptococcus dysgalactiae]MDY2963747.1 hypothetical protein [Streptococcus dysgalactiae]
MVGHAVIPCNYSERFEKKWQRDRLNELISFYAVALANELEK